MKKKKKKTSRSKNGELSIHYSRRSIEGKHSIP